MRISTNTLFAQGAARIGELQSSANKIQTQISTGRRILTPADDPVGAAQALVVKQAQSANEQYAVNRSNAKSAMSLQEGILQDVTSLMQDMKALVVQAGNGALDDAQRKYIATEMSGRLDDLLSLANSRDGMGNFIFSGYQSTTQPFVRTPTGAEYKGDTGQRQLQVGPSRLMTTSDPGSALFGGFKANGSFNIAAAVANTGNAELSSEVTDAGKLTGHQYAVNFTVNAGVTSYSVTNRFTGAEVVPSTVHNPGDPIEFDGIRIAVTNTPDDGDTFSVQPGKTDVFAVFTDLIGLLNTPLSDDASKTALKSGLSIANGDLTNMLDGVLTARASLGTRLKEIDSLDDQGAELEIQYAQQLEQLESLDYVKAITELTKRMTILEAARQSFVKTSGLSLFNYLN